MRSRIERIYMGFEGCALDRAADWILERFGEDQKDILVALPGSRAARALREKLARRAPPSWTPPCVLTQGDLIDEMVLLDRPVAGRLARTLAWARALSELPRPRLEVLAARPPAPDDLRGAFALAETVRALHAELAQEGLGFQRLASGPDRPTSAGEARRFEVLAEAQGRWREILDGLGLADPHESRFAAIDAGRVDPVRRVVLVGVADMNRLLRKLVERLGARASALVVAPAELADAFDETGCVRTDFWKDRDLDFEPGSWRLAEGPQDQAESAVAILAGFGGRFAPEELSIGVCDEEVAPYLERRFSEEGIVARHAAGTAIEITRPFRLLADLAAWLSRRAFAPYAALLRHPDLESSLRSRSGDLDIPAALDVYHECHLPGWVDGRWLAGGGEWLRAIHAALLESLGDLASDEPRPLAEWPARIRAFLAATYPTTIDPAVEEQRVLAESLTRLSDALGDIERLHGSLGRTQATAAAALDLVAAISRGEFVPPPPAASGKPVIELLGWLDLPLDDALALVVTGFQEGFVPHARRDDPFLPDRLRKKLGLPCADDRVARDVYAATALLASKKEVAFVSGSKNREGDLRMPSRLVFHVPRAEILARAGEMSRKTGPRRAERPLTAGSYALPKLEPCPPLNRPPQWPVEAMRVTAFKSYLASPYGFYLEHVLRLETLDDSAREMDAKALGNLAHEVLEGFGRSDLRDSTDERQIAEWLRERVDEIGRGRYGARPLPAVGLQLAQLGRRFGLFARAQARRAAEGWRILHVEWKPASAVVLPMGAGEDPMPLLGKIDRIDVHEESGEWAILDYKTGLSAKDPDRAHRARSGEWRDLQLPLYTLLARELGLARELDFPREPALGYFTIGKDESETDVFLAPWKRAHIDGAIEAARQVVRGIRRGELFDLGRRFPDEPILLAIAGKGLLEAVEAEEGEAEAKTNGEVGDG